MTDETTAYRLAGWLRLVPEGDCLGIPVFSDGSNTEFVPETDDRLRISAFHAFYNEEGYFIERRLPTEASMVGYTVGTGVPIPFARGALTIIANSGDSSGAFLEAQGHYRGDPTVKAVAQILEQSETGAFEAEGLARKELDLLLEEPTHSRYWIAQLKRIAQDSLPFDPVVLATLKGAAIEWLRRFQTSGDPALLGAVMQVVEKYNLGHSGLAKETYFGVATHLLSTNNYKDLLDPGLAMQIREAIPEGLYYYDIGSNPLRRGRRAESQSDDVNLLSHMKAIIYDGESRLDFRPALVATNMMFGREALHPDIHALAAQTANYLVDRIERGVRSYMGRPPKALDDLLTMRRALLTLRQIMDWTVRSDSAVVALGLSQTATRLMNEWLEARSNLDFS